MQREKFRDAEQMWFWFLYSRKIPHVTNRNSRGACRRACELVDVETLITKLYLAGRLSDEQLAVMKKFGDRRRAPNPNAWPEKDAAKLWADAMQTISTAATRAGWIETTGDAL